MRQQSPSVALHRGETFARKVDRLVQELYALYAQHREKIADMRATCAAAVLQGCRDCNIDRSLKEICKAASPEKEMKKQLSKAHRDLMKVLQQRQHAEAKRRGINVEDLTEFSKARAALGGDEDAEKHKLHAANMVPRFGSDLGLTSRGIQVCGLASATAHMQALYVSLPPC